MKQIGNAAMGPTDGMGSDWVEINLPYEENRNEDEVDLDPRYWGPMPRWEIWDWLEAVVPDLHDEVSGSVCWWRARQQFSFFFREKKTAAKFYLRFGGSLFITDLPNEAS